MFSYHFERVLPATAKEKPHTNASVQVWLGVGLGLLISLIIAGALIGVFYTVGVNAWSKGEMYYEGAFCIVASIIITVMGAGLLRVGKLQEKWRVKLAAALEGPVIKRNHIHGGGKLDGAWVTFKAFCEKYAMFVLPFITVLREAIEAIVFIAGVTFTAPATSVPLPVVIGILAGSVIGYALYK